MKTKFVIIHRLLQSDASAEYYALTQLLRNYDIEFKADSGSIIDTPYARVSFHHGSIPSCFDGLYPDIYNSDTVNGNKYLEVRAAARNGRYENMMNLYQTVLFGTDLTVKQVIILHKYRKRDMIMMYTDVMTMLYNNDIIYTTGDQPFTLKVGGNLIAFFSGLRVEEITRMNPTHFFSDTSYIVDMLWRRSQPKARFIQPNEEDLLDVLSQYNN